MPSIKQAELDGMKTGLEMAVERAAHHEAVATERGRLVNRFDAILDKIVRAANGRPLIENARISDGWGYNAGMVTALDPNHKPSKSERQEREIANLNERVVELERRLSAVNAVATFAKEHKA